MRLHWLKVDLTPEYKSFRNETWRTRLLFPDEYFSSSSSRGQGLGPRCWELPSLNWVVSCRVRAVDTPLPQVGLQSWCYQQLHTPSSCWAASILKETPGLIGQSFGRQGRLPWRGLKVLAGSSTADLSKQKAGEVGRALLSFIVHLLHQ